MESEKQYISISELKDRFKRRVKWLEKDVHDQYSLGLFHGAEYDVKLIDEIPMADVAEVTHGKWIIENETSIRCSECCFNRASIKMPLNYCPMCGTKMVGG